MLQIMRSQSELPAAELVFRGRCAAGWRAWLQVSVRIMRNDSQTNLESFCYPEGCAAPGGVRCQCYTRGSLSKLERTPPHVKINVTSKSPVGDISVVTLIRTDTTLDHSQKAEKV